MPTDIYIPTTADGLAMHKLRRMVALSSTLQTRCELSYAELYQRCFYRDCDNEEQRPLYVIDLMSGADTLLAVGPGNEMIPKGSLILLVELFPRADLNQSDARLESIEIFSKVRTDISSLSAVDDPGSDDGTSHLCILESTLFGVEETPREEVTASNPLVFCGVFMFTWGTGEG